MEKWVNFIKLKCAHWQPTKHSEVCVAHFTDENYTNLFADLTDNSCNRFKQKLKSVQWPVYKGRASFSTQYFQ